MKICHPDQEFIPQPVGTLLVKQLYLFESLFISGMIR